MNNKRIVGLDILRILSMCGIVGLHMINQGGVIDNIAPDSMRYPFVLSLLTIFYLSVNTFGILSGYLSIEKKKQKYQRIIELLSILFFYILIHAAVFYAFNIGGIRQEGIGTLATSLFPFAAGRYWYITSYVLLFFVMPFLNKLANSLTKQQYARLLATLFVFMSIIPNLFLKTDFFNINNGYSPFWLMFLYLLGGYAKLYPFKKKQAIRGLLIGVIAAFVSNYIVRLLSYKLIGEVKLGGLMIDYVSPLNVLASMSLVVLFSELKGRGNKIITWFSTAAFSVYIMHGNLFFVYILKDCLKWSNDINVALQILVIVGYIAAIYIVATFLDQIRVLLFKGVRVERLFEKMAARIDGRIGINEK